jgi:iron complex transport system substrate-binding protein
MRGSVRENRSWRASVKSPNWLWARVALLGLGILLCAPSVSAPRNMLDEAGRTVNVPDFPKRIVSLAPNLTECLFALGLDEEVVGVTQYSNYPPEAASRPKVGSYVQINLEQVVSLKPDLVLATRDGNPREQVDRLVAMGICLYATDPRTLEGLFRTLETLGKILHREERAEGIVQGLKARLARVDDLVAHRSRPRVLLQVGINPLVSVGRGTLQDHLIELAGGENVAAEAPVPYPVLSMERILEARPEVILVSSMVEKTDASAEIRKWSRWREIPAVAQGRLHVIDGDLIDRPSPRILEGLEEMLSRIHPEVAGELGKR